MSAARDLMTAGADCIRENETLNRAARLLRDLDVDTLPICRDDGHLVGMLSDRDIVVKCLAEDGDPATTSAVSLADGMPVVVDADEGVDEVIETMRAYEVRRVLVTDKGVLVGTLDEHDLVNGLPPEMVADLVEESAD